MLKANHKKYTLRGHGKRAWRHVSKWTWSLISLFEVSTDRHRPTCSYELCFQLRLPILLLRVMLGCIALLRLKRQNQFLQLPGVEDVIMKMSYFKGFFSTLHVAMKFLVHFYLYERPPKPPTFWNSHTRALILDTIMKLSGTIGVTQKTMAFDTHVGLILLHTLNPQEQWWTHDIKKRWPFQPTSFRRCNRFSPLLIYGIY